ncbi:MAG TPA: thioredoxin domain-containing protein, partial [Vicinamibacterales bacterium]|nr:thioredoxin domain-containing protein [Vicinamibacterales bacterium]
DVAGVLNDNFVSIKVDREERPDIDAIYMEAVQAMTGQGGWPMSVFLTPDGRPFYGGTYFPPEDRYGMPSFRSLLAAIIDAWTTKRSEIETQASTLVDHVGFSARLQPSTEVLDRSLIGRAVNDLARSFDAEWGGFGSAPKFPQPATIDLLLRAANDGHGDALPMVERTLDAMASGGMFDQLAGGFARYSVDRHWVVPHFEKMLYDNAQLIRTYARAHVVTGKPRFREVVAATVDWLGREMRDPAGGFHSSLDADSEGEEGKFYVWSFDELTEVLGDDLDAAVARWGLTREGNFEGKNIPVLADETVAGEQIDRARDRLLARRAQRVRPGTDTKVLTAWNGLTASTLAEAGARLQHPEWIDVAREIMEFVLGTLVVDGRVMRTYGTRDGRPDVRHLGFCEDYAFSIEASLALFETTFDATWLDRAVTLADDALELFEDRERGGFFTTGSDAPALLTRSKDIIDGALPAANSVMALELQRLGLITGEERFENAALGALRLVRDPMERSPGAFSHALAALDFYTSSPIELVIVGDVAAHDTRRLIEVAESNNLPNRVLLVSDGPKPSIPLLEDRVAVDGKATAYLCRRGVCKLPVTDPDALAEQIAAA